MKRDIDRLAKTTYDLLVVGGGIYGAAQAREARLAGLNAAVIDKGDFCSATSANSLKIIHGGIRYLQQMDIIRLRQSVTERRVLLRIAPQLVHPLRCAMPTRGHFMRSREIMFLGMMANDILGFDRNSGLPLDRRISRGHVGSRAEWLKIAPSLDDPRYTGAAIWSDACAYNTERLALAFLQAGGDAANYVEITGFLKNGDNVAGVKAVDRLTGRSLDISAKLTVINTGPWTGETLGMLGDNVSCPRFRLALTMNLVLRRQLVKDCAIGLEARREGWSKKRLFFFVPWRGQTMVGTYMRPHEGPANAMKVTAADVEAFLDGINRAYPGANLRQEDISMIHAGLQPSDDRDLLPGEEPSPLNHFRIVDHSLSDGIAGIVTVLGVKYTTARDVAQRVIGKIAPRLGGNGDTDGRSKSDPLPGGDFESMERLVAEIVQAGLSEGIARRLATNHGTGYGAVIALGREHKRLLEPVGEKSDVIGAEVINAVRNEMAMTLADVVLRRTDLGSAGMPGDEALRQVAVLMAKESGWNDARMQMEIETVRELPNYWKAGKRA